MFTDADWWRTSISPPWTATTVFQFIYILVHLLIVPWELRTQFIVPWELRTQFLCISFTNGPVWSNSLALLSLISCCADILGCQTAISSLMESTLPSSTMSMTGTVVKDHCLPGHGTCQPYTCTSIFFILLEFSGFHILWFDSGSLHSTYLQKSYFWTACGVATKIYRFVRWACIGFQKNGTLHCLQY